MTIDPAYESTARLYDAAHAAMPSLGPDAQFWRYELEHLLCRAGFTQVELFGDFDRSPIRRDSPALLVVAR